MGNKKILNYNFKYKELILLLLGTLSSLGFAPFHFFPVTIFSYVFLIFLFSYEKKVKKKIFIYGYLYSMGMHLGLLYWIAISFQTANSGGYLAGGIAIFLLCSFLSIFFALSFYFLFKLNNNYKNIKFGIFFIFIFTLFDWLKGNIFWGFPWTPISTLWSFSSQSLYPFSVFGVWGYSLITYSLIISIYYFFFNFKKGLFFLFPFIFSLLILPNFFKAKEKNVDSIFIRIIQPNIKQEDKWKEEKLFSNYEELISLINLPSEKKIDLLVLPETAINLNIKGFEKNNYLNIFAAEHFKSIIFGAVRLEKNNKHINVFNSLYLIKKNDKEISYHDKLKLVPFGEFIPFSKFINLDKLTAGNKDFSKGEEPKILKLSSKINILPLICYEVIFPELTKVLKNNYSLIVNITNDGWYKNSSGPYQHFSHAKIRAVMEGVTLIRSANTGVSGIISPEGNILRKLSLENKGIVDYRLNVRTLETVYSIYREKVFYLIMLTLLFLIGISFFYDVIFKVKKSNRS